MFLRQLNWMKYFSFLFFGIVLLVQLLLGRISSLVFMTRFFSYSYTHLMTILSKLRFILVKNQEIAWLFGARWICELPTTPESSSLFFRDWLCTHVSGNRFWDVLIHLLIHPSLDGNTIHKRIVVAANLYCIHRDPCYWKNLEKVDPLRFLDKNKKLLRPDGFAMLSIGT